MLSWGWVHGVPPEAGRLSFPGSPCQGLTPLRVGRLPWVRKKGPLRFSDINPDTSLDVNLKSGLSVRLVTLYTGAPGRYDQPIFSSSALDLRTWLDVLNYVKLESLAWKRTIVQKLIP
ncbi:hypothetical protein AVEN_16784-1 [Araneus ventricosus]|uniref:Uncharacterized protein n=1 Tax=Araneus ventricosus TaxID=182803 RepID=A0A4Y2BRH4_ARAVE|nr:hypothetical protein AVEN_16784-1 [Araneus ventricosus]